MRQTEAEWKSLKVKNTKVVIPWILFLPFFCSLKSTLSLKLSVTPKEPPGLYYFHRRKTKLELTLESPNQSLIAAVVFLAHLNKLLDETELFNVSATRWHYINAFAFTFPVFPKSSREGGKILDKAIHLVFLKLL